MADTAADHAPDTPPPVNVIQALARIKAELPAFDKNKTAPANMGGYAYRGIEAITAAASKLEAAYGVVWVPRVTKVETKELIINGKPWTDTTLTVEYDIYGPQGVNDKIVCGPLIGIGRDNSDKGSNKAETQAFKMAMTEVYCISDQNADTDGTTHEADAVQTPQPVDPEIKANFDKMVQLVAATEPAGERELLASHLRGKFGAPLEMKHKDVEAAILIAQTWPPPRPEAGYPETHTEDPEGKNDPIQVVPAEQPSMGERF